MYNWGHGVVGECSQYMVLVNVYNTCGVYYEPRLVGEGGMLRSKPGLAVTRKSLSFTASLYHHGDL